MRQQIEQQLTYFMYAHSILANIKTQESCATVGVVCQRDVANIL